ncbi:unnamed protein product [Pieris macdunnoughi]|uniref:Flavin-containing monooxygenase n=1 Tax=Pieris macdunnoughi TaxID=345717 RepID=A0A821VPK9_9NEOP|nr:unnamed protein product [Pieris macdunnoughi]
MVLYAVMLFLLLNRPSNSDIIKPQVNSPRVCIIGAGLAGITSGKNLQDQGLSFTILEATTTFGGTWRYEPRVGVYENGLPVFSSMYKHLRTNLPKPTMELSGFPMPDGVPSFPTWEVYYNYLLRYVHHFQLEKYMQFQHYVTRVSRVNGVWRVRHKYLPTGEEIEDEFDYVIVATGHFSQPNRPVLNGEHIFKGNIIHSHDYREPDSYRGRKVLSVGAGPSGLDITLDIASVADTVYHSHHSPMKFKTQFPPNYVKKPDIKEFNETGVLFVDGSYADVDDVIYCTGYLFNYSFLDESAGLNISSKSVMPLHKFMVNINEPSLIIVGLIEKACLAKALEAQARYTAALVKGKFSLPSKADMMKEWQRRADACAERGLTFGKLHYLEEKEDDYYEELSQESGIDRVPPVIYKIRQTDAKAKFENLLTYRNYVYEIIDDNTFLRRLEGDTEAQ